MFIGAPVSLCTASGAMTTKYFASEEKTPSVLIAARRMLMFFCGIDRNCARREAVVRDGKNDVCG